MSKKSKNPRKAAGHAKNPMLGPMLGRYDEPMGPFGEWWDMRASGDNGGSGSLKLLLALQSRDAKAVAAALDLPHLNMMKIACYTGEGPVGDFSALHVAAYLDDHASVDVLLNAGFDANARTTMGTVPLHHTDDPRIIKALVAAGANVNAVDNTGMSALMIATMADSRDVVHALLAAGADPDAIGGTTQETALSLARLTGMHAIERVLVHVTTVAAPSLPEPPYTTVGGGFTMLHNVAALGDNARVEELLQKGASSSVVTENGLTAGLVAILNGHGATARLILNHRFQQTNPTFSPITDEEFAGYVMRARHTLGLLNYQLAPMADA